MNVLEELLELATKARAEVDTHLAMHPDTWEAFARGCAPLQADGALPVPMYRGTEVETTRHVARGTVETHRGLKVFDCLLCRSRRYAGEG